MNYWSLIENIYRSLSCGRYFYPTAGIYERSVYNVPLFQYTAYKSYLPNFNYVLPSVKSNYNVCNEVCDSGQNLVSWEKIGYCASAGKRLAQTALNSAVGFIGYCARYVKRAIAKCGLGEYTSGNACDMVGVLRKNKNFREISSKNVNLKTLPAGCILVYGKGVAGYSSKYGHIEIATGTGRCVSDGITKNPRGVPTAIFVPVAA